jgi:hypothetical protein
LSTRIVDDAYFANADAFVHAKPIITTDWTTTIESDNRLLELEDVAREPA